MKKPKLDLKELPIGKIFQINPELKNTHPVSLRYGGDFLVAEEYMEWGILGYLAMVYPSDTSRHKGLAYLRVEWEAIEPCGDVQWLLLSGKEPDVS